MRNFCQAITPLFKGLLRCFFVVMPMAFEGLRADMYFVITGCTQQKLFNKS